MLCCLGIDAARCIRERLLHWMPAIASRETSTTAAKLRQLGQRKARLSSYAQRNLKPLAAT